MATINDLQAKRWNAIDPTIPFAPDNAIQRFWLEHPELGSPLGAETATGGRLGRPGVRQRRPDLDGRDGVAQV